MPKNVQDYLPENHVARVISRIIDFIDYVTDEATDDHQVVPLTEHVKKNIGTPENVGTDAGFFSYNNIEYCKKEGITPYIPHNFYEVEGKKKTKKKRKLEFEMKKQRSTTVEPTFGNMKFNKKFTHFLLRGMEKA